MSDMTEAKEIAAALREEMVDALTDAGRALTAAELQDVCHLSGDRAQLAKQLRRLLDDGQIELGDLRAPEEIRRGARPVQTYRLPARQADATDAALVAAIRAAEDGRDPDAALDDAPDDGSVGDPVMSQIDREGAALASPAQDVQRIVARVRRGIPFVSDKLPTWAAQIDELCELALEVAA